MDEMDEKTRGPEAPCDLPHERTPRELLRFRGRIAAGYYDRLHVAEKLARRILFRRDLDLPPGR